MAMQLRERTKEEIWAGKEGEEFSPDHFEPVRTRRNYKDGLHSLQGYVKSRRCCGFGWRSIGNKGLHSLPGC